MDDSSIELMNIANRIDAFANRMRRMINDRKNKVWILNVREVLNIM